MATEAEILASYPQTAPKSAGSGYPGNLTPEQEKALQHLRDLLKMEGYEKRLDDGTLLRFLRARKFDVHKAHTMFVECENWRKKYGTDTILEDFVYTENEEVMKIYPQFYHKTDKEGRPVYYEILGKVDITAMNKITSQERMLRNLVFEYESFSRFRLPASSRKVGHLVETSCTVFDLKGVSLSTASSVYSYVREASVISQNYYPERMGKFYVVNAPFGFSTVWQMIKRFLDPVTVSKIHILGSKYKTELLKQIPAENLPEKFGGTSKSEKHIYFADDGPWRDPKYVGPEGLAPMKSSDNQRSYAPSIASTARSTAPSTPAPAEDQNKVPA